mgnify:CR=1 FL=1
MLVEYHWWLMQCLQLHHTSPLLDLRTEFSWSCVHLFLGASQSGWHQIEHESAVNTAVCCLPFAVCHPLSAIHCLLSAVCCLCPLSAVRCLLCGSAMISPTHLHFTSCSRCFPHKTIAFHVFNIYITTMNHDSAWRHYEYTQTANVSLLVRFILTATAEVTAASDIKRS